MSRGAASERQDERPRENAPYCPEQGESHSADRDLESWSSSRLPGGMYCMVGAPFANLRLLRSALSSALCCHVEGIRPTSGRRPFGLVTCKERLWQMSVTS